MQLKDGDIKQQYLSIHSDMNGIRIKEGNYLSETIRIKRTNRDFIGYEKPVHGVIFVNEPYKEWFESCTSIYLVQWDGDCLVAERVGQTGGLNSIGGIATYDLKSHFKGCNFEIIGSKYDNFPVSKYIKELKRELYDKRNT